MELSLARSQRHAERMIDSDVATRLPNRRDARVPQLFSLMCPNSCIFIVLPGCIACKLRDECSVLVTRWATLSYCLPTWFLAGGDVLASWHSSPCLAAPVGCLASLLSHATFSPRLRATSRVSRCTKKNRRIGRERTRKERRWMPPGRPIFPEKPRHLRF